MTNNLSGGGVNYVAKQVLVFLGKEDLVFVGLGAEVDSSNSQNGSSVNTSRFGRKGSYTDTVLELIRSSGERSVD